MSEFISLKEAIATVKEAYENDELFDGYEYRLNELPSTEIIYCRECRYMYLDPDNHDCWCKNIGRKVWLDHYCGCAKRRE